MVMILVKKLAEDVIVPVFAKEGDAGADLCASENTYINPGDFACVPTGIAAEIPLGYEMQIRPRSGLAAKNGVTVLNSPGTIDSGYRGEIKVILINHGKRTFLINKGDRIAQAVINACVPTEYIGTDELSGSDRGSNGFGSTGIATIA